MTTTSFTELRRTAIGLALGGMVAGCGGEPAAGPSPAKKGALGADYWVERTDTELDLVLRDACRASVADGQPMLLQFSASWCADCNLVKKMSATAPLSDELEGWHKVVVNVGNFDQHRSLMKAFDVSAIVHWVALQPVSCEGSPARWPRLKEGTLEPKTGTSGPRSPEQVVAWLRDARR